MQITLNNCVISVRKKRSASGHLICTRHPTSDSERDRVTTTAATSAAAAAASALTLLLLLLLLLIPVPQTWKWNCARLKLTSLLCWPGGRAGVRPSALSVKRVRPSQPPRHLALPPFPPASCFLLPFPSPYKALLLAYIPNSHIKNPYANKTYV